MLVSGRTAQPVSWGRHRTWSWRRPEGYAFARELRSVPVALADTASAASCFPLVFRPGPEGPVPHVLLRRAALGRSPFVGRDGQWQASWLPPRLAAWPFDLVKAPSGHSLALHEASDLVSEGWGAMLIFAEGTAPSLSSETAQVAALLKAEAESLPATTRAVAALGERGLLSSS